MSELRRSVLIAGVVVALTAAITSTVQHQDRLQHLAVPTLQRVEGTAAPARSRLLPFEEVLSEELLARVGRRISAIERDAHGTIWIGLFDGGLARLTPGADRVEHVATRPGRERFVSDVLVDGDRVYAATFAGVLEVNAQGERVRLHLEGVGVEALGLAGRQVFAGTAKGLYLRDPSGAFVPVDSGAERPRVTAMTTVEDRLWLATARGVHVVSAGGETRWIPLVFGSPGATTNVATAVAPDGQGGVVVGTDDGGVVRVTAEGAVSAIAFEEPRANEINPGAASRIGGAVALGTQGGGVLWVARGEPVRQLARGAAVSAVAADGEALLLGTAEGELRRVVVSKAEETRSASVSAPDV